VTGRSGRSRFRHRSRGARIRRGRLEPTSPNDLAGLIDLNDPVAVGVGDQRVPVRKSVCVPGPLDLIVFPEPGLGPFAVLALELLDLCVLGVGDEDGRSRPDSRG